MGITGRAPAAGGRVFYTSTPTGPRAPRGSPPRRRLTVAANGGGNIDDRQGNPPYRPPAVIIKVRSTAMIGRASIDAASKAGKR